MEILDTPVQTSPRKLLPGLLVGAAVLWILGAGRFKPNPSRRRGRRHRRRSRR